MVRQEKRRNTGPTTPRAKLSPAYADLVPPGALDPDPPGCLFFPNFSVLKYRGGIPAAQFMHGFNLGGIAAITRANDPFWNMRAFDNELSKHDGYRLSSFICAINQLVMDNITTSTPAMPSKARDPTQPPTTAPN